MEAQAVIVAADMVTPYGEGPGALWEGLQSGRSAIAPVSRFDTRAFQSSTAGTVKGLNYHGGESLVVQMLGRLFARMADTVPGDARLILATTKGEIDILERAVLGKGGDPDDCRLDRLARKASSLAGLRDAGMVVSAACASGTAAVARAAAAVRCGRSDCVLVVACDAVTEFVYSGFSSLMALDPDAARPFDRERKGLSLGEAAACALIMSGDRARRENRPILGAIVGWGLSDDANHMTGPSRTSEGLILAIRKALAWAGLSAGDIGCISAHGTGTSYNDAMEMRAFRAVLSDHPVPIYSVKGGIGHTLGAAGLVEVVMAMKALRERIAPPTVNLREPDADAAEWVSPSPRGLGERRAALVTNAGFSGINAAIVVAAGS